jgi:putative oxidoreductase
MRPLSFTQKIISWICRILAAVILLQTLFFKFTAAPESVYIFSKLGLEPWGRIGIGVGELIASILLFVPGWTWLGATLALGLMGGAIMSHLTVLGISVQNDHGELFALAVTVALCSAVILFLYRATIPFVGPYLARFFAAEKN